MSKIFWISCGGLATALCFQPPLAAQGTIVDDDAAFVRGATAFDGTPEASLTGVSVVLTDDHLHETGWWFRVVGATQETPPGAPTTQTYTGQSSTLVWNFVAATGIPGGEISTVVDGGQPGGGQDGGSVRMSFTLINTTAAAVTVDVFHYVDFDVQPTSNNDSAVLVEYPNRIRITDPGGNFAEYRAGDTTAWQVAAFPLLRSAFNDTLVTDLSSSGAPFGPGDVTAAMQWSDVLVPPDAGSVTLTAVIAVNVPLACGRIGDGIFCDGFESQNTLFWTGA